MSYFLNQVFICNSQNLHYYTEGRELDERVNKTGEIRSSEASVSWHTQTKTHFLVFWSSISIHILHPLPVMWWWRGADPAGNWATDAQKGALISSFPRISSSSSSMWNQTSPPSFVFFHKSLSQVSCWWEVMLQCPLKLAYSSHSESGNVCLKSLSFFLNNWHFISILSINRYHLIQAEESC